MERSGFSDGGENGEEWDDSGVDQQQQQQQQQMVAYEQYGDDNGVALEQPQTSEELIQHLLADAYDQLPQTLLHMDDPIRLKLPVGATEADRMEALAPFLSPLIQSQTEVISDRPVVTSTDKILNAVLPPRTFSVFDDHSQQEIEFVQCARRSQATRQELAELKQMLDFKLKDCKARMIGICPVRSAIMEMLADELLRQVTIDQPERGLLLRRIRDEARMTLEAYQSLHAASTQYGSQKLLEGARGCPEMLARIQTLTEETTALNKEVKRLEARHASLLRCVEEQTQSDARRHSEEKAFLENSRKRLQQHLETVKQMQDQERRALMGEA